MKATMFILMFIFISSCQSVLKKKVDEVKQTDPPKLLKPQVKKIWVPSEIQDGGRVYIDGHWRYEVERSTSFGR